jgi:serine/threonine-protein kinase
LTAVGLATSLKNYRLVAELGHGGMADVYLAVAEGPVGFNKLVVIKKMKPELAEDPDALTMFLDEARLAARLSHPNIVQTYEIGHEGNQYFIAMEYLEGKALQAARSATHGGMPLPAQLRVLSDVLAGLDYAHELRDFDGTALRVVHRDVSPQNVFITYQGSIKLVDFGIAKAVDSSQQTRTGVVKGKVTYMAPEQAHGRAVDRRADLFSVGILIWEAVVGRRIWKGIPDITIVHELLNARIPVLRSAAPDVAPEIERIVSRALAPDPEERFSSAAEMHEALEAVIATMPERPTARDVGAALSARFAEDRARVRSVVETQLGNVRWSGVNPRVTSSALPSVGTPMAPTPSTSRVMKHEGTPSSAGSLTAPSFPLGPQPTRRAPVLAFALVGGAALAGLVFGARALLMKSGEHPITADATRASSAAAVAPDPPPPAATAPPPAASAAPAAAMVNLTVTVQPSNARVLLDGVLLGTGGYRGQVAKGSDVHVLRVEADKLKPREQKISLGADLVVEIDLGEAPGRARVGGGARPVKPPLAPTAEPPPAAAATGQRPNREIDRDNPYSKGGQ